jgi:hypothetical protein
MKRNYESGVKDSVTFFTGNEIEHTPAYGMHTLFVVGLHDPDEIQAVIDNYGNEITHIYFGANMSFCPSGQDSWHMWEQMIGEFLDRDLWCTLDLDAVHAAQLAESRLVEHRRFIPQISVKLPYLRFLGYNATLKIDDSDFAFSNPGVWCHNLQSLCTRDVFTDWDAYGKDTIIK